MVQKEFIKLAMSLSRCQAVNAVPSTSQEMADCNRTLTAQELYQVDIGQISILFY